MGNKIQFLSDHVDTNRYVPQHFFFSNECFNFTRIYDAPDMCILHKNAYKYIIDL